MLRLLDVNLSTGEAEEEVLPEYGAWIGGRGLGAALLREARPRAEPFSEENQVLVSTSPLVGLLPAVNRVWVTTISPLTSAYTCSSAGGRFAHGLRRSGYEVLRIRGRSEEPVYIDIKDGRAELHSASGFWGLGNYSTAEELKKKHGGAVLSIGPAGENLVRYASVQFGLHSAGRGGHGAVLGWKRLKAVVARGRQPLPRLDAGLSKEVLFEMKAMAPWARAGGTLGFTSTVNSVQAYPTDNWRFTSFDKPVDFRAFREFMQGRHGCYNCTVRCGKLMKGALGVGDGPEYEIAWAFGANLNQGDAGLVVEANYLCDDLGMDAVNAGGAVAWHRECVEKGLAEDEEPLELIRKIAGREGIGDILAEGARSAGRKLGGSEFSVDVRGMSLPAYDPRVLRGMVYSYILPRYGCHLKAWTAGEELDMSPGERSSPRGKAELALELAVERAWLDSTCCCSFVPLEAGTAARAMSSLGVEVELTEAGRRILKTELEINRMRGINNAALPPRVLEEQVEAKGRKVRIGGREFAEMMEEFSRLLESL